MAAVRDISAGKKAKNIVLGGSLRVFAGADRSSKDFLGVYFLAWVSYGQGDSQAKA